MKRIMRITLFLVVALAANAETTVNQTNKNAYGANIGWINAQGDITNGAVIGQSFCTGFVWSANCGWISFGKGPTNGWRYSNLSFNDWGVNHDGEGRLTGCAYGANIGWITFEQTNGQPRINLLTGNLSGYAYGANVGWISLSNSQAYVKSTLSAGTDTDGDGIPDAWERRRTGNLTALGGGTNDADHDGASNRAEYLADTNPTDGNDSFEIVSLTTVSGTNTVKWTTRPTRLYRVEATNALRAAAGGWADAGGGLISPPAVSPATATILNGGATARFYRVRAVIPLSGE
jgi:hypothetical protein